MTYQLTSNIRTPEDLAIAIIGSPYTAIVPPKQPISRADYGRRLADLESGTFTPSGYLVPTKNGREINNAD